MKAVESYRLVAAEYPHTALSSNRCFYWQQQLGVLLANPTSAICDSIIAATQVNAEQTARKHELYRHHHAELADLLARHATRHELLLQRRATDTVPADQLASGAHNALTSAWTLATAGPEAQITLACTVIRALGPLQQALQPQLDTVTNLSDVVTLANAVHHVLLISPPPEGPAPASNVVACLKDLLAAVDCLPENLFLISLKDAAKAVLQTSTPHAFLTEWMTFTSGTDGVTEDKPAQLNALRKSFLGLMSFCLVRSVAVF
jgi:hypothetical protein